MRLILRESVQKIILASLLLAIPLYMKFPIIEIPQTYVRIRLEDFLLFFVSIYLVIYYLPRIKLFLGSLERSIVLYWLVGLASLFSAIYVTQTVIPHIGFLHLLRRIEYMVVLFFALTLVRQKRSEYLDFIIKLLLVIVVVVFVYGAGQKFFSWPVIITQNEQYSKGIALRFLPGAHLTSTFAGHYDLSSFMVMVLPILITSFFIVKGKFSKLFIGTTSLMGLWVLALASSRTSIVSYFAAVVIALLLAKKVKAVLVVLIVSVVIFSFSSNLFDRYWTLINVAKERFLSIVVVEVYAQGPSVLAIEDRSTSIRLNVEWPRAIRAFQKNPLLGSGFSSITLATDNDYLRALGEVGIIGVASFFLIFGNLFKEIKEKIPLHKSFQGLELGFVAGMLGAIPGVFVNALFIDVFESSKFAIVFWLLVGILVYLVRSKHNEKII